MLRAVYHSCAALSNVRCHVVAAKNFLCYHATTAVPLQAVSLRVRREVLAVTDILIMFVVGVAASVVGSYVYHKIFK